MLYWPSLWSAEAHVKHLTVPRRYWVTNSCAAQLTVEGPRSRLTQCPHSWLLRHPWGASVPTYPSLALHEIFYRTLWDKVYWLLHHLNRHLMRSSIEWTKVIGLIEILERIQTYEQHCHADPSYSFAEIPFRNFDSLESSIFSNFFDQTICSLLSKYKRKLSHPFEILVQLKSLPQSWTKMFNAIRN